MRLFSALLSILPARSERLRLRDLLESRCPDPAFEYLNLPVAVLRNRLAALLLVFFFGITTLSLSCQKYAAATARRAALVTRRAKHTPPVSSRPANFGEKNHGLPYRSPVLTVWPMEIKTLHVGIFEVNCYIIWGPERQALVIDPGSDSKKILQLLDKKQLTVSAYLLTHGHMDHVSGVAPLLKERPAPVALHADDQAWIFSEENAFPPHYPVPVTFPIERTLTDGQEASDAGMDYRIIATPGHTPGGVCILMGDALFTGDTLFAGSAGRTDLYGGSARTLQESLKKLTLLDDAIRVFPGHGPSSTIAREKKTNFFLRA
jgi:hydroxyacylglutathione hydrolase